MSIADHIGPSSLTITMEQNGAQTLLPLGVQLNGNDIVYTGSVIPANVMLTCLLHMLDANGNLIQRSNTITVAMPAAAGGVAKVSPDSPLQLNVNPNNLPQDAYLTIASVPAGEASGLNGAQSSDAQFPQTTVAVTPICFPLKRLPTFILIAWRIRHIGI